MRSDVDSGPNLLLDWNETPDRPRWFRAGIGSVAVHLVLFALGFAIGSLETPRPRDLTQIASNLHKVTPLYAPPPKELTQKDPNRGKVSQEVNVEGLLEHKPAPTAPPQPPLRSFKPPVPLKQLPQQAALPRLSEPPKIDTAVNVPPAITPPAGAPAAPPPQIQSEEKPKLTFETPGQHSTSSNPALAKIAPPKTSVDDAIRSVARGGGNQGSVVVEDMEPPPNIPGTFHQAPSLPRAHSSLELMSDPLGVDFKPYLIRILSLVRQNWFAVIPESARLGNRGTVQLQFVIDRSGHVPKLVIATPSGSEALDKAAVAGVSATVPFPPLPQEFKGKEIRLQFSFKYNIR
ncbi:MAG TPA: energy transducer TonB [Bryobacteraceae bacterium]